MPAAKTVLETGCEPEYMIDDFGNPEFLKDGDIRIPVCAEWKGALRVEYFVRVHKTTLAELGRRCLEIASESHNTDENAIILDRAH